MNLDLYTPSPLPSSAQLHLSRRLVPAGPGGHGAECLLQPLPPTKPFPTRPGRPGSPAVTPHFSPRISASLVTSVSPSCSFKLDPEGTSRQIPPFVMFMELVIVYAVMAPPDAREHSSWLQWWVLPFGRKGGSSGTRVTSSPCPTSCTFFFSMKHLNGLSDSAISGVHASYVTESARLCTESCFLLKWL